MRPLQVLLLLMVVFSAQVQAELPHRNSLGLRTSIGDYGVTLTSVQSMDDIGGELDTFFFQARVSRALSSAQQLQFDVTRYTRRSLNTWDRSSRYRLGWVYRWQSDNIDWSGTFRIAHRDVPGNQHQRTELGLQAGWDMGDWSPYVSGQVRYHLTDSYVLTRRINLGANYALTEDWTFGVYVRHGQTKRSGEWDSASSVLGTSFTLRF